MIQNTSCCAWCNVEIRGYDQNNPTTLLMNNGLLIALHERCKSTFFDMEKKKGIAAGWDSASCHVFYGSGGGGGGSTTG